MGTDMLAARRARKTATERRRRRLIAYGRWQGRVDAEPVRAHVRALMAAPETCLSIAARAGVGSMTVKALLYGNKGWPPTRRMCPEIAAALLALQPRPQPRSVDVTGTRRRAQALLNLGWTYTEQARRAGLHRQFYINMLAKDRVAVSVRTAAKVRAVYEQLSGTLGPDVRSKKRAAAAGYPPPHAWDDATIDDPAAEPQGLRNGEGHVSRLVRLAGEDVDEIAVLRVVEQGRSDDPDRDLWARMNRAERRAVVARLLELRWTRSLIGDHLRLSGRTLAEYMPSDGAEQTPEQEMENAA